MTSQLTGNARRLFDSHGVHGDLNPNALKIRRVMQLCADMTGKPLSELRILDLACGPGTYAIEAAMHGARTVGIDARNDRMDEGKKVAGELGLDARFEQGDVRRISVETHGPFDVVLVLGILYHLEAADSLKLVRSAASIAPVVIVDTHISLKGGTYIEMDGWSYEGHHFREHLPGESAAERRKKLLASIDNETAFWFTRKSLTDLLLRAGFTSVTEAHAPGEPNKPADRVTFVGRRGEAVQSVGFPWLNDMDQAEVERRFPPSTKPKARRSLLQRLIGHLRLRHPSL